MEHTLEINEKSFESRLQAAFPPRFAGGCRLKMGLKT